MNLPHVAKHAVGDQIGPNIPKAMPFGSPPHQGLKNCELSQKKYFLFGPFLGPLGCFPRFSRCWPYSMAGIPFGGSGRTRKAKCSMV